MTLLETYKRMYWINLPFDQAMNNERTRALIEIHARRLTWEKEKHEETNKN